MASHYVTLLSPTFTQAIRTAILKLVFILVKRMSTRFMSISLVAASMSRRLPTQPQSRNSIHTLAFMSRIGRRHSKFHIFSLNYGLFQVVSCEIVKVQTKARNNEEAWTRYLKSGCSTVHFHEKWKIIMGDCSPKRKRQRPRNVEVWVLAGRARPATATLEMGSSEAGK